VTVATCALHIGVASPALQDYVAGVHPQKGAFWGTLQERVQGYAERSVASMVELCRRFSISSRAPWLGSAATLAALEQAFDRAVGEIGSDGLLVITFAGHGRLLPDESNDEPDGCDTAWLLHDGFLLDDRLRGWLHRVPQDCHVIVVGDCCRAGGMELLEERICHDNPRAQPDHPPPSSRVYINAVDKDSLWVPGNGDETFAERVSNILRSPTACESYAALQAELCEVSTINRRHVIKCRPEQMWSARPFVKS
jgi:hypothetical protein